jgi:hypothetical protein
MREMQGEILNKIITDNYKGLSFFFKGLNVV